MTITTAAPNDGLHATSALINRIVGSFRADMQVHPDTDPATGTAVLTWHGSSFFVYLEIEATGDRADVRADMSASVVPFFLAGAFRSRNGYTLIPTGQLGLRQRVRCAIVTTPTGDDEDFALTRNHGPEVAIHLLGLPVDDLVVALQELNLGMVLAY